MKATNMLKQVTAKDLEAALPWAMGVAVGGVVYLFFGQYADAHINRIPSRKPPKEYVDDEGVTRTAYHDAASGKYYAGADVAEQQRGNTSERIKTQQEYYDEWVSLGKPYDDFAKWYTITYLGGS